VADRQKLGQAYLVLGGDDRDRVGRVRPHPAGEIARLEALARLATSGVPLSSAG
jgi:hypothetical protein